MQKIERPTRKFNTLKVPRKLQAALPYASKPKILKPQREQTYMQKRAVIMEPEAKQALGLLQQIQAIEKNKVAKRKDKQQERRVDKQKKMAKGQEAKEEREKREKKDVRLQILSHCAELMCLLLAFPQTGSGREAQGRCGEQAIEEVEAGGLIHCSLFTSMLRLQ